MQGEGFLAEQWRLLELPALIFGMGQQGFIGLHLAGTQLQPITERLKFLFQIAMTEDGLQIGDETPMHTADDPANIPIMKPQGGHRLLQKIIGGLDEWMFEGATEGKPVEFDRFGQISLLQGFDKPGYRLLLSRLQDARPGHRLFQGTLIGAGAGQQPQELWIPLRGQAVEQFDQKTDRRQRFGQRLAGRFHHPPRPGQRLGNGGAEFHVFPGLDHLGQKIGHPFYPADGATEFLSLQGIHPQLLQQPLLGHFFLFSTKDHEQMIFFGG